MKKERKEIKVIPTVFSRNKKEFKEKYTKLKAITREIQFDIMDGKFVEEKSIQLKDIPNMFQTHTIAEAHLMVKEPKKYIDTLRKKGFGRIIFHYESVKNDEEATQIIKKIRSYGMHAVLAINSKTKLQKQQLFNSNSNLKYCSSIFIRSKRNISFIVFNNTFNHC